MDSPQVITAAVMGAIIAGAVTITATGLMVIPWPPVFVVAFGATGYYLSHKPSLRSVIGTGCNLTALVLVCLPVLFGLTAYLIRDVHAFDVVRFLYAYAFALILAILATISGYIVDR